MVVALRFARFASAGNERFLRASRNYSPQIPVSKRNYLYPLDREMKNRVFFLSLFLSFFFFFHRRWRLGRGIIRSDRAGGQFAPTWATMEAALGNNRSDPCARTEWMERTVITDGPNRSLES